MDRIKIRSPSPNIYNEIHQIWQQPNSDNNKQSKLDINIQYNKFKLKGAVKNTRFDKYL